MNKFLLLKVIKANNVLFVIICILIMGQNFMGHDLLVLCLNIGNITNITVKWIDYFCINFHITNLIQFICWETNWLIMVHYIKCRSKKLLWKTELLFYAFKQIKKKIRNKKIQSMGKAISMLSLHYHELTGKAE